MIPHIEEQSGSRRISFARDGEENFTQTSSAGLNRGGAIVNEANGRNREGIIAASIETILEVIVVSDRRPGFIRGIHQMLHRGLEEVDMVRIERIESFFIKRTSLKSSSQFYVVFRLPQ